MAKEYTKIIFETSDHCLYAFYKYDKIKRYYVEDNKLYSLSFASETDYDCHGTVIKVEEIEGESTPDINQKVWNYFFLHDLEQSKRQGRYHFN